MTKARNYSTSLIKAVDIEGCWKTSLDRGLYSSDPGSCILLKILCFIPRMSKIKKGEHKNTGKILFALSVITFSLVHPNRVDPGQI